MNLSKLLTRCIPFSSVKFSIKDLLYLTTICGLVCGWTLDYYRREISPGDLKQSREELRENNAAITKAYEGHLLISRKKRELEEELQDLERSCRVTKKRMEELDAEFYQLRDKVVEAREQANVK